MKTKPLVVTSLLVALATVLNMVPIVKMPQGGTAALCPSLFIVLVGFIYGKKYGLMACIASSAISFLMDPWFLSPVQFILDYGFAKCALAIGPFLFANDTKYALEKYYISGMFLSFVFAVLSGVAFFASSAPDGMNPFVYSITYNASYMLVEAVIVLVVLSIPSFKHRLMAEVTKLRV